eukprot:TRINITY_DN16488_c0_g1_i1.p1 TRINITY_DN16488_c0_g1~~TRINITY_DN16488_c0_g1_i1.p1  ORF type:complete len:427 (-),score=35.84 TRINITY_DN16488_c0_g1_i1:927-2207(-)
MAEDASGSVEELACLRCSKPARLQCPKCLEMKLPRANAAFCSQECFKISWSTHKAVHKVAPPASQQEQHSQQNGDTPMGERRATENGAAVQTLTVMESALAEGWQFVTRKGQTRSNVCPNFEWTGPLRPFPVSPRRPVPLHIARPEWAATGSPVEEASSLWQTAVEIKNEDQIRRLRRVCRVSREVLDVAAAAIRPGITTNEIDRLVHDATIAFGGYPSPLNYYFFPKSCCTSVNEVICHGIPDARVLEDGDIVNVDVSVYLDGAHGDLNETYVVGKGASGESKRLIKASLECLERAIAIVKPGVRFREVGDVINRHASSCGFAVVKSYCGHGIGELFHCAPNIPHYAKNKAVGVMKAGQTFTIEPMINAGSWRDRLWADGWTAVTADGSRSAQFEHTLVVTEDGCEVLTARLPTSPAVFPWATDA